jgi:hypothetical protein
MHCPCLCQHSSAAKAHRSHHMDMPHPTHSTPPQVQAERVAVAAALSELELLVTKLVGVGIYDLQPKHWRQRLRGRTSVDELCESPLLCMA